MRPCWKVIGACSAQDACFRTTRGGWSRSGSSPGKSLLLRLLQTLGIFFPPLLAGPAAGRTCAPQRPAVLLGKTSAT